MVLLDGCQIGAGLWNAGEQIMAGVAVRRAEIADSRDFFRRELRPFHDLVGYGKRMLEVGRVGDCRHCQASPNCKDDGNDSGTYGAPLQDL